MEKKEQAEKAREAAEKAVPEKKEESGKEDSKPEKKEECAREVQEKIEPEKKGEGACGKKEAGKHKAKLDEIKEALQRVQAEFENSRKRFEKEKLDFALFANASLVKELLPLLDSIDAAERHLGEQENVSRDDALKAMELAKKQLLAVLKAHGLRGIECIGKKFDPLLEDCVMQGKDEKKGDDVVLEELQKGYALNGRVLRHAKVKVNKL